MALGEPGDNQWEEFHEPAAAHSTARGIPAAATAHVQTKQPLTWGNSVFPSIHAAYDYDVYLA
jgi:hypothetical protein